MRNVLIVSRNFPPTNHVSVERAMKLAKYLPEFGWRPTVLTGNRGTAGLPVDPELLTQVSGVEVIRTAAPEFSFFYSRPKKSGGSEGAQRHMRRRGVLHPKSWLVPDSQLLWYPLAVRAALRHARRAQWDAVLATSFPPTALLIAHTVARRLDLPYVADFRDSWTRYHQAPTRPPPLAKLERQLEVRILRDAAAIVAVDGRMVEHALARIPPDDRPPLHLIPNGYDEDDFRGVAPAELPSFSIVHTGQLRRSPRPLWDALSHAMHERPELHGNLHLWQVGFIERSAMADLTAPPPGVVVHQIPPVSPREAVSYMLGADLLLVEEFESVMPSKTLQYLRAGRPILGYLDGGGIIRDVLRSIPRAHLLRRDQAMQAGRLIVSLSTDPPDRPNFPDPAVAQYSRREIARRFAGVLEAASAERRGLSTSTPRHEITGMPSTWRHRASGESRL